MTSWASVIRVELGFIYISEQCVKVYIWTIPSTSAPVVFISLMAFDAISMAFHGVHKAFNHLPLMKDHLRKMSAVALAVGGNILGATTWLLEERTRGVNLRFETDTLTNTESGTESACQNAWSTPIRHARSTLYSACALADCWILKSFQNGWPFQTRP